MYVEIAVFGRRRKKETKLKPHADRLLSWTGCYNVRDLGGLVTRDGKVTRHGALVRSDLPVRLDNDGRAALHRHGVRTVIDLRFSIERDQAPNPFESPALFDGEIAYRPVSLLGEDIESLDAVLVGKATPAEQYSAELDYARSEVADIFRTIVEAAPGGVLIHCHAGKDRTGMVIALLLGLVGVPDEAIAEDYALSDSCLEAYYEAELKKAKSEDERERMMKGRIYTLPENILGVLAHLEKTYGGVEPYLFQCGLEARTLQAVRERLLTDPE